MSAVGRSSVPLRDSAEKAFTAFVEQHERQLREALTAAFGVEVGREATADALAEAWLRWDRVATMDNPVGYLYVVGRNRARRDLKRRSTATLRIAAPAFDASPSVEPALAGALSTLSERERAVVLLLHGFDWSMGEIAKTLDISKSSVQSYAERGLDKLRSGIGVGR